jgi:phosphate transport system substrate-binding protein
MLALLVALGACGTQKTDRGTPAPAAAVRIQNKGSDTMVNLALAWAEAYGQIHPEVEIAVTGGGSGTGIAALINKTADIANASRQIKTEERSQAQANGVEPMEVEVARDAIAIVVHPSNPVNGLTVPQLSAIFSGQITNWREVGGQDRPIVLLSRESNSGTHVFFLEHVVRQGSTDDRTLFSPDTLLMPSSEGISAEVRRNPNAIGYDGLGYVTPDQKVVAVAPAAAKPYVLPMVATVNDGSYPIARALYVYTAGESQGAIRAYLDWILGPAGQEIVKAQGFVPLQQSDIGDGVQGLVIGPFPRWQDSESE